MDTTLRSPESRGFALIVTLTLMILLTVIAVGLLTLSSISLRQSNALRAMALAQNNARIALFLALGELQNQAGPDQRVTATADMAADADGARLTTGKVPVNNTSLSGLNNGLTTLQPGTRYWTGVWKNNSNDPAREIFSQTPSPVLAKWLVSGNEAGKAFTPSSANCAVNSAGEIQDPSTAVILVGKYTVGGTTAVDQYVAAPLVEIRSTNSTKPDGRYAWWIGDEGVKSRINLPKTLTDAKNYSSLTSQRRGWETVSGFANYPPPSSAQESSLPKIISLPTTGLLLPGAMTPGWPTQLQSVFHSATTDSKSVIADCLAGGTKVDLSAVFASNLPSTAPADAKSIANYPIQNGPIIPKTAGTPGEKMVAPVWDTLKEFNDRYASLSGGSLLVKPANGPNSPSIKPLVTDFRLVMGARLVPKGGATAAATATAFRIQPCAKIAIAIANPYSVPLKWANDLEFRFINKTAGGNRPSRLYVSDGSTVGPFADGKASFLPLYPNRDGGSGSPEPAVFHEAVFRIKSGSLPAGGARAYTMGAPALRPAGSLAPVTVDLVPLTAAADPTNFENCIEMASNDADSRTPPITLDVREDWQTSLAMMEMRLAGMTGGSEPLLQIESFEWDSALDFMRNGTRTFTTADACRLMTKPIGIQLFNFQISQPGEEYDKQFIGSLFFKMGQRATTMRTFADFNVSATRITKPIASYNPPPYFCKSSDSVGDLLQTPPGGDISGKFTSNLLSSPLKWGRGSSGPSQTVLFTIPQQVSSLAEFQHADLTGDDVRGSIGHQPGNACGNSYASPFIKRNLTREKRTNYVLMGITNMTGARQEPANFYDISYLLNAALWDGFFLSTIPASGASMSPQVPAITLANPSDTSSELRDPVLAAPRLMINGGFNVNSTDKNAWKVLLASTKHFKHNADTANPTDAAFPRSLEQTSPAAVPPTGAAADSFSGFRRLTDSQLDALAEEITRQVRLRGPFLSLSHFINRALAPLDVKTRALSRSGALQLAIDESGANINLAGNKNAFKSTSFSPIKDKVTLQVKNGAPCSDFDGEIESKYWLRDYRPADAVYKVPDWGKTSDGGNYGSVASIISDRQILNDASFKSEQGYRSTGIPGWLTQADVLQVIGPAITARSDTFRIRTYGEALDPNGKTIATAYCEAIVQRIPNYVDSSNAASKRGDELSTTNKTYGRKYQIVSFRWLSPSEV